ncbi:HlyC/CorC family transporter [Candidatus Peregrinibacteria bacterium]|jgi:putative hemolysin|nr:HlyC/CorC family transporter [Candidatus Peregrinibacteria bacterium]
MIDVLMDYQILIIIGLLFLSGFFSASETALMTITPAKVRTLVDSKKPGSKYLALLKKHHHKTLISILIGNNLVNITAASLTTLLMTDYYGSAAVGVATGLLTIVVLIFGEVIPKSLATTYANKLSLLVAPILFWFAIIITPLIWILDGLVKFLLLLLGTKKQKQVTDEELIAMAAIGEEEGTIDEHERELIENVLEFNDIRVEEIMTPRVHMDAMPEDHSVAEAAQFIIHKTHSRIPVYRETVDNIVGILTVKELIKCMHNDDDTEELTVRQIKTATPLKVLHSMPIHDLFHQFKTKRTHMAIVIDEHGGTAGLITMEDLLEELVGDIEDEEDSTEDRIKTIGDGVFELSGRVELDELHELTGLEFNHPEYKTVSFLITEQMGRLPRKGQSVEIEGWSFKVTQMWRHTIFKVELKKIKE